jgi:LPXTG-motif cell wall-anchored protein
MSKNAESSNDSQSRWLFWVGINLGVVAAAALVWLFLRKRKLAFQAALAAPESLSGPEIELPLEPIVMPVEEAPVEAAEALPVQPDDLTKIEGIGPKISGALQAAGIQTFAQLAELTAEAIKPVLVKAGVRIANPASWPEQAALAARGQWEALAELQSDLKGGRRAG